MKGNSMKDEYDLSAMASRKNPYAKRLKKQITLRLDPDVITYFRELSTENEIPYQSLINLYLKDCVRERRTLDLTWCPSEEAQQTD